MLFICAYCVIFCHLFLFHASFSQYIFFFPFFNNRFSLSPSSFSPILLYSLQLFFHFFINTFSFFHIFLSARSSFYFYRRFSLHFPRINARIPHRIYGFCRKGPLMNLLNEENPVHIFLNKIGDIIIANLLFILCCIPVITIGPALTALYHCMLRTVKGNNNGTVKTFFRAFKENFIQSLVVWLCLLAGALILVLNINFLQSSASPAANVLFYVSLGIAGLLVLFFLYIFPVIAAFANTTLNLVKNAFVFAFMHFPSTLAIAVLSILPMYMTYQDLKLMPLYACCWFFFGFGLTAYINSLLFYRMFKPFLEKEDSHGV